MGFLESIGSLREKAGEAAQLAARKSKKLAEIAKANVSIYSEEDKIKKAENELGKLYYRDYAVGEEMDVAEYLPWCQKIDESKQTIADLRDYIEELKAEQVEMEEDTEEPAPLEEDFADAAPEEEGKEEPEVEIEIVVCDSNQPEEAAGEEAETEE